MTGVLKKIALWIAVALLIVTTVQISRLTIAVVVSHGDYVPILTFSVQPED